jgi:hypothetical protein
MSIWDTPEMQPPTEDYVKLENPGDGFSGRVIRVVAQKFDDGSVAPNIVFFDDRDGEERSWTAGQIESKKQLVELRPDTGDHIDVRYTHKESLGSGKSKKHIKITVTHPGQQQQHDMAAVTSAPPSTAVNVPTYQPAPPPVYAMNAGNGNGAAGNGVTSPTRVAEPAVPTGIDPAMWARMGADQRQQLLAAMGMTPAF